MRIKLDKKHYLISEPGCCWIVCETKSKSGKSSERRVSGYVPTFEMAVRFGAKPILQDMMAPKYMFG